MGLFDKVFDEFQRTIDKHAPEDKGLSKATRRAGMDRGQWGQALGVGGIGKSQWQARLDVQRGGGKGLERVAKSDFSQLGSSVYGANIGHQMANAGRASGSIAPQSVAPGPGQGAGNEAAQRAARSRAIQQARQRYGFQQTIATSPLGLQGEGASLSKRTLVGE